MPVILVIDMSSELIAQVDELQPTFENWSGPKRMCLFMNQSALANNNESHSILQYLPLELAGKDYQELSWYLEDYVPTGAFEKARAGRAKKILEDYGKRLVQVVDWPSLIQEEQRDERLTIRIMCDDTRTEHVFWEILEDPKVWKDADFPLRDIHIHRLRALDSPGVNLQGTEGGSKSKGLASSITQDSLLKDNDPTTSGKSLEVLKEDATIEVDGIVPAEKFNILVVSARVRSDEDIPHRLVTQVITAKVLESGDPNINWRLVRPGTWDSFLLELEAFPPGHFDIVHFDVHGVEDKEIGNSLLFIKPDESNIGRMIPDPRAGTEVAHVLARNKVKTVILNACRSAKGSRVDKNIATTIINSGVEACLAMSHNITARAVELFVAAIYDAMLIHKLSLPSAAQVARRSIRQFPERITGLGEHAEVDDWVVPIVYVGEPYMPSGAPVVGGYIKIPNEDFFLREPYGREADILSIESALLTSKRPINIVGPAGIGKTTLVKELVTWWQRTGLVDQVCYVQAENGPVWNIEVVCRAIHEDLLGDRPYISQEEIISYLIDNRVLVIFDSIESIVIQDRRARRSYHREFPQLLRRLQGGKSLVLLTSRHSCDFLSDCTIEHRLKGLPTIGAMQFIKKLWKDVGSLSVSMEDPDHVLFLEQLIKLIEGHPVALLIIIADLLQSRLNPREYLAELLAGKTLDIDEDFLEAFRCLRDLQQLIISVQPGVTDVLHIESLAMFWQEIPEKHFALFETIYSRRLGRQFGSNPMERMQAAMELMNMFAPGVVDTHPLGQMMQQITSNPIENPPERWGGLELDELFLTLFDLDMEELVHANPAMPFLIVGYSRFLTPLKKFGYLQPMDPNMVPDHLHHLEYLSVNPILPLLLRNSPVYQMNLLNMASAIQQSSAYYYTYRVRRWPFRQLYYNASWKNPRRELEFEFYNFTSSALSFINLGMTAEKVTVEDLSMIRALAIFHRGVDIDVSRLRVAHLLWEKVIILLKRYEYLLKAEIRDLRAVSWTHPMAAAPETESVYPDSVEEEVPITPGFAEPDIETKISFARLKLWTMRIYLMSLAGQVIIADHREQSPRQHALLNMVRRVHGDMKADLRDPMADFEENTEYMEKSLDYTLWQCEMAVKAEKDLKQMWAVREKLHRMVIEHNNSRSDAEEDGYGPDVYPETQQDWMSLPLDVLSMSAQVRDLMPAMQSIRRAIDGGHLDEARREIEGALRLEMFHNANDPANKATLLRLRSEVAQMEGEVEDARRLYQEARELEERAVIRI